MPKEKERIVLSWSGGKDSAMALWELRRQGAYDVTALVSVMTEEDDRITMHGITRCLLEQQAAAIGLPLELVYVPRHPSNQVYLARLNQVLERFRGEGIRKVAFGDLYLDDLRDFREENLENIGMEAVFPLWHRDTRELSQAFLNAKFKAIVVCVDDQTLDAAFTGRLYDRHFLGDLPITVDPCGENGEFHTFVFDGPMFHQPVAITAGSRRSCDRFHFCDLVTGMAERTKRSRRASRTS